MRTFLKPLKLLVLAAATAVLLTGADYFPSLKLADIYADSYGAVGDGSTDDTSAIQNALNAASANGGGIVRLGPKQYKIGGTVSVPADVQLVGVSAASAAHSQLGTPPMSLTTGTTLLVTGGSGGNESSTATITVNNGGSVRNVKMYWPNQSASAGTPTAYPYAIRFQNNATADNSGYAEGVELVNAYYGIDIQTGRVTLSKIFGQALAKGVRVDAAQDTVRLEDIHFNPYWSYGQASATWQLANGTAFDIRRADQFFARSCFAFNYNVGVSLSAGSSGGGPYGSFVSGGLDQCNTPVNASATNAAGDGVSFVDTWFATNGNPSLIRACVVTFYNCKFWTTASTANHIKLGNVGTDVAISGCHFNGTISGTVINNDATANVRINNNAYITGTNPYVTIASTSNGYVSEPSLTNSGVSNASSGVTVSTSTGLSNANNVASGTSTGSAAFAIDASGASTLSIANNGTATPFSNADNFSGLIIVNDPSVSGSTAMFVVGGGSIILVSQSQPTSGFTVTQANAGTSNLYRSGGVITIENKTGSTVTYRVYALRLRTSG